MIFLSRKGHELTDKINFALEHHDMRFIMVPEEDQMQISSSHIREILASNAPERAQEMLADGVYEYIKEQGAYNINHQ